MSEQDRLHAFILARLQVIEATLMMLINETGKSKEIKKHVSLAVESWKTHALYEGLSDEESAVLSHGYEKSLAAIFHELPPS